MCASSSSWPLTDAALAACDQHPDSDVEAALAFCHSSVPAFCAADNDRLVKVGRSVRSLLNLFSSTTTATSNNNNDDDDEPDTKKIKTTTLGETEKKDLEASLAMLVDECNLLISNQCKVPRVPFGKTGLSMPIVTLGCMRFQQAWGPHITNMNMVQADCQDNLVAILKRAILDFGMNHIETARGYGSSELQLGVALKQLFATTSIRREDIILQTKVNAMKDPKQFRQTLETSFAKLQVDYLDLFAFHGLNLPIQMEWIFGGKDSTNETETCYSVIQEYVKAGKIRHIGFSTHGSTDLILECIRKDVFSYVNLHYHFVGSYTASGGGPDGHGNRECIRLLNKKQMGVFIISPFDKGGALYRPSRTMRKLTLPELEPMAFECLRIWNHHELFPGLHCHTFTNGAARPSDLDQSAVAAYWHVHREENGVVNKLKTVHQRLLDHQVQVLGKDWAATWWKGLTKANDNPHLIEHNQIVWIYICTIVYGLYHFAQARYASFESNAKNWKSTETVEQNLERLRIGWGFVPGLPLDRTVDYLQTVDLQHVPAANVELVQRAHAFVFEYLATPPPPSTKEEEEDQKGTAARSKIPQEWMDSYDMRTWDDFPNRIKRVE